MVLGSSELYPADLDWNPVFKNNGRTVFITIVPSCNSSVEKLHQCVGVSGFGDAAFNTVVLSTACSALVVLFSAPAAYVLARSKARSAEALTSYFAIGAAIPFQTIVVPLVAVSVWLQIFMTNHVLGWWDSRITLGLFYVALSLPFSVFLLAGYFRSLPGELEEAAMLDGASPLRAFWEIMMPVARPSLTTVFLLTFVGLWNETLLVLLLVPDPELRTLPASLLSLYNTMQFTSNWGGLFAGVVILVFPIVAIYIWLAGELQKA